jgi:signal peptidase II
MKFNKTKVLPFILTGLIVLADQAVKSFIVKNWPLRTVGGQEFIKDVFNNGIVQFWHVRNPDIAFSLGRGMPDNLRPILFIVLPLAVLGFLLWYYIKSNEFTTLQRWAVAGIIGGGLGNILDRILRLKTGGVVDFISIKFYGIFGFERWPTFNIADSSVVICCIMLVLTMLISPKKDQPGAVK